MVGSTQLNNVSSGPTPSLSSPRSAVSMALMARTTSIWASSTWWTWLAMRGRIKQDPTQLEGKPQSAGSGGNGGGNDASEKPKETSKINLPLSALGNVTAALVDNRSTHIPDWYSKLTQLLQYSLKGNAKTTTVALLEPAP